VCERSHCPLEGEDPAYWWELPLYCLSGLAGLAAVVLAVWWR
jgi:hypothetical protein